MPTEIVLDPVQMALLLKRIHALADSWVAKALPVFAAALLAYGFAWYLDKQKTKNKENSFARKRLEKELMLLSGTITALAANMMLMTHTAKQQIIPRHRHCRGALAYLEDLNPGIGSFTNWINDINSRFGETSKLCPELYFEKINFFKDLSFLLNLKPNLLIKAVLVISFSRQLKSIMLERNSSIRNNQSSDGSKGSDLGWARWYIRQQFSISRSEVSIAFQYMDSLRYVNSQIEAVIEEGYTEVAGYKGKIQPHPAFEEAMTELEDLMRSVGEDPKACRLR